MRKTIALLCVLLLAAIACGPHETEISADAKTDLALLPEDTNMVLYCDVSKVSEAPLAKDIRQQIENQMRRDLEDKEYEQFKEATGFDPQKDLHRVLVGSTEQMRHRSDFHAVIHGNFDERKIAAYLRQKIEEEEKKIPWSEEKVGNYTIYASNRQDDFGLCFYDNNTIYAGEKNWIEKVLKNESAGVSDQVLATLSKSIRYGDQFWVNLNVTEEFRKSSHFPRELRHNVPRVDEVKQVVFSAKVNEGVTFEGFVHCENEETSKLLVDLMKGGLAAAKLQVAKDRPAVDALNSIEVSQKKNDAVIRGELSAAFFEKLREHRLLFWEDKFADAI